MMKDENLREALMLGAALMRIEAMKLKNAADGTDERHLNEGKKYQDAADTIGNHVAYLTRVGAV